MARSGRRGATRKTGGSATSPGPRWLWLVVVLLLGILLGYGGYLVQSKWAEVKHRGVASVEAPAEPKLKSKPSTAQKDAKEGNERRFDFYTLLPEMEVHITDDKVRDALRSPPHDSRPETYILQIGSFRRMEEADAMKAKLALLGFEATIQTVVIRDDDVWYRVRVGPYDSLKEVSQVSTRLRKNDVGFMILRLGA